MSAVTLSSLSLAFQEIVVPWLVAHHVFDVTVNQSFFGEDLMDVELSMQWLFCLCFSFWSLCTRRARSWSSRNRLFFWCWIDCRKDASLLNNVTLQIVDFIVTIVYPPKFWRFLSLLYEKYELTKKVGSVFACLRRSVMKRTRELLWWSIIRTNRSMWRV